MVQKFVGVFIIFNRKEFQYKVDSEEMFWKQEMQTNQFISNHQYDFTFRLDKALFYSFL